MAGWRVAGLLLGAVVLGIAGGYGAGVVTLPELAGTPGAVAAPLAAGSSADLPRKTPTPDPTEALRVDESEYRPVEFTAELSVRSQVGVEVPSGWSFTQPKENEGRYTDPLRKRWIRIQAGFPPTQSTAASMKLRVRQLLAVPPDEDLRLVSQETGSAKHDDGTPLIYKTLTYTYVPETVRRSVMVRWISFGRPDLVAVEMSVTGLPQDRSTLRSLLQHATESVTRTDG